jgi:hypothetical protein
MHNNITIELLEKSDILKASECLAKGFLREPMNEVLKITFQESLDFCTKVVSKAAISSQLSVVAIDSETRNIIGVCINKDLLDSPFEDNDVISEKFSPINNLLDDLDAEYHNKNVIGSNEVFHSFMIAVDSDIKVKNLSSALLKASLELANKKGFKKSVIEATGAISQHVAIDKFGFNEFCSINYTDFIYEDKHVFRDITSVSSCKLVTKELG